jgi:hypothetical protein
MHSLNHMPYLSDDVVEGAHQSGWQLISVEGHSLLRPGAPRLPHAMLPHAMLVEIQGRRGGRRGGATRLTQRAERCHWAMWAVRLGRIGGGSLACIRSSHKGLLLGWGEALSGSSWHHSCRGSGGSSVGGGGKRRGLSKGSGEARGLLPRLLHSLGRSVATQPHQIGAPNHHQLISAARGEEVSVLRELGGQGGAGVAVQSVDQAALTDVPDAQRGVLGRRQGVVATRVDGERSHSTGVCGVVLNELMGADVPQLETSVCAACRHSLSVL